MKRKISLAAVAIIIVVAAVAVYSWQAQSKGNIHNRMERFLSTFYSISDDNHMDLSVQDSTREQLESIYNKDYQSLLCYDEFEQMCANRYILNLSRIVSDSGCKLLFDKCIFSPYTLVDDNWRKYSDEADLLLITGDNVSHPVTCKGSLQVHREGKKWMVNRFDPDIKKLVEEINSFID